MDSEDEKKTQSFDLESRCECCFMISNYSYLDFAEA
jgi:hypothetical protein